MDTHTEDTTKTYRHCLEVGDDQDLVHWREKGRREEERRGEKGGEGEGGGENGEMGR